MTVPEWVVPDWVPPASVRALATTRSGGVSDAPFDSFNLGDHVGDRVEAVTENRRRLAGHLGPVRPVWLDQVHGISVAYLDDANTHINGANGTRTTADASWTDQTGIACAILTADCLPVLLCDRAGSVVAAAHCGWRGLSAGLLAVLLDALPVPAVDLLAWLGPGISSANYEVGDDVRQGFAGSVFDWPAAVLDTCFQGNPRGRYQADLAGLATWYLRSVGVEVFGGDACTVAEPRFFSYRRDGTCGRMGSLIWREESA